MEQVSLLTSFSSTAYQTLPQNPHSSLLKITISQRKEYKLIFPILYFILSIHKRQVATSTFKLFETPPQNNRTYLNHLLTHTLDPLSTLTASADTHSTDPLLPPSPISIFNSHAFALARSGVDSDADLPFLRLLLLLPLRAAAALAPGDDISDFFTRRLGVGAVATTAAGGLGLLLLLLLLLFPPGDLIFVFCVCAAGTDDR